jgi:myo-inositol-1(or 4)-monophosphatase
VAPEQVEFKDKQQRDPVTAIDRAIEAQVRAELQARFPTHGILGEEGTGDAGSSPYLWVLDPIDGTANFASGLPFYGLSLALLEDGRPIVGCVYVPFWPGTGGGEVLRASRGNGARIGERRVRLERQPFRPGGPMAVPPGLRAMFAVRGELAKRPGEARNLGSIVAEIAMVATGGFQYAVFGGPKLWDVAAGAVIVQEAGGMETGRSRSWSPVRAPRATSAGVLCPAGRHRRPSAGCWDDAASCATGGARGAAGRSGSERRATPRRPRPRPDDLA